MNNTAAAVSIIGILPYTVTVSAQLRFFVTISSVLCCWFRAMLLVWIWPWQGQCNVHSPCQSLTFSWLTFKCTLQAVFWRIFLIHFGKEKATLIWALTKIFSCQVDINTTSRLKSFLRALTHTQNGPVELWKKMSNTFHKALTIIFFGELCWHWTTCKAWKGWPNFFKFNTF